MKYVANGDVITQFFQWILCYEYRTAKGSKSYVVINRVHDSQ
jgi:hypothetical protein